MISSYLLFRTNSSLPTHDLTQDFRIYSTYLNATAISAIPCGPNTTTTLSRCDSLMGYYTFENNTNDISLSRWGATFYNSFQANMYAGSPEDGTMAARFDGVDDYIGLSPRFIQYQAFSVCTHVNFNQFSSWARVMDFSNGPYNANILWSNEGGRGWSLN